MSILQSIGESTPNETMTTKVYTPMDKVVWEGFLSGSKNGVFLFSRDYMDYHQDRFQDHSLLFFKNNHLVGLLPANLSGDTLQSHGGLTFGGIIAGYSMKTPLMIEIFNALMTHCISLGIKEIIYKPTPYIYHSVPAEEDIYALFTLNAKLIARGVSSTILMSAEKKFTHNKRNCIQKAKKNKLAVKETNDYEGFMGILEENLVSRHGVKPVHTTTEIKLLAGRFPNNIKLFASYKDDKMLAGLLTYESTNVVHVQYAANSQNGMTLGAEDIVIDYLINERFKDKRFFDFGISTENRGRLLNKGLIKYKEDFGASAVVYDMYQIVI